MNSELVSIILPIYNAEKYLYRCLKSIKDQSYGNLEIIMVDDCSTDSSREICRSFSADDPRFKLIQLSVNSGAGEARRVGIEASTGSIIGFIDSDDWIDRNFVSILYGKMLSTNSEIVSCQALHCNPDGSVFCNAPIDIDTSVTPKEALIYLDGERVLFPVLWDKLFRREIILSGEIKSEDCEDAYALVQYIESATKIAICSLPLYNYNKTDNALSSSVSLASHYRFYCHMAKLLYDKYGYSSPYIIKKGIRLIECAAYIKSDGKIREDFIAAISESLRSLQQLKKSRGISIKYAMVLNRRKAYIKGKKILNDMLFNHKRNRHNKAFGNIIYQNSLRQVIKMLQNQT